MNDMVRVKLVGAVARGWCHEKNSHKEMDVDLALAIVAEVEKLFAPILRTVELLEAVTPGAVHS